MLATALVCVAMLLLISSPSDVSSDYAVAANERTYTTASAPNIMQCVNVVDGAYTSNCSSIFTEVSGGTALLRKIPDDHTVCSFTSARMIGGSGAVHNFDYLFYDAETGTTSLETVTSRGPEVFNGTNLFVTKIDDEGNKVAYTDSSTCYTATDGTLTDGALAFYGEPLGAYFNATFNLSQEIIDALADRLLTVTITPYVITAEQTRSENITISDSDPDKARLICFWYNYDDQNNKGKLQRSIPGGRIEIPIGDDCVFGNNSLRVDTGKYDSRSFFQVTLYDYQMVGSSLSSAIVELGIKVTVTPNSGVEFEDVNSGSSGHKSSTYTISGTNRNDDEGTSFDISYAAIDSIINFQMVISAGGSNVVYLDALSAYEENQAQSGIIFQKLFNPFNEASVKSGDPVTYQIASVIPSRTVPPNTYYEFNEGSSTYFLTGDSTFQASKKYYKPQYYERSGDDYVVTLDTTFNADKTYYVRPLVVDYSYPYKGESGSMILDQSSSETGQNANIIVKGGNKNNLLLIRVSIKYKKLDVTGGYTGDYSIVSFRDITVYVDKQSPAAPSLSQNEFYNTYLREDGTLAFFTGTGDAVYATSGSGEVTTLNVASEIEDKNKPQFTLSSLDAKEQKLNGQMQTLGISGGSDLTVYYKATYWGETYPTDPGDKVSDGVNLSGLTGGVNNTDLKRDFYKRVAPTENSEGYFIGVYCKTEGIDSTINDQGQTLKVKYLTIDYKDLLIDMTFYDPAVSDHIGYRKKGVWAIEFFAYDNVGNYNYYTIKYFLKVDITTYEFNVQYYLGDGAEMTLERSKFQIRYETVTLSGSLNGKGKFSGEQIAPGDNSVGKMSLYRGDRVCLQMTYANNEVYDQYILTAIQIGGGTKQKCTELETKRVGAAYRTVLGLTNATVKDADFRDVESDYYTFEVSDSLCRGTNRSINLFFKKRIRLSASGYDVNYNGSSKKIEPFAYYVEDNVSTNLPTLSIAVTYYEEIPADSYDPLYEDENGFYWCSVRSENLPNAEGVVVKNCDCNVFATVLKNNGATTGLTNHSLAHLDDMVFYYCDDLTDYFSLSYDSYTDSLPFEYYQSFVSLGGEDADEEQYDKGGFISLNGDFDVVYRDDITVDRETMLTVVSRLFGYTNTELFKEYAGNIATYLSANQEGAATTSSAKRLKYDGSVYTSNDYFILPYYFLNELIGNELLGVYVFVSPEGKMYFWFSDYELAMRTANYNNMLGLRTTDTATLDVFGRCLVFSDDETSSAGDNVYRGKMNATHSLSKDGTKVIRDEEFVPVTGAMLAGVQYYRKVMVPIGEDSYSNFPVDKGTYYCVCTVKNSADYYGMAVIGLFISAGVPKLSGLYGNSTNTKGERLEIDYGTSLASLAWVDLKDSQGNYIVRNQTDYSGKQTFNKEFYLFYTDASSGQMVTSSGVDDNLVLGYFDLAYSGSEMLKSFYQKPSAGFTTIKVRFVPIQGVAEWANGEIVLTPVYDEQGRFIRNENYVTVDVNVNLYVRPSNLVTFRLDSSMRVVTEDENDVISFTYSGGDQAVVCSVLSNYENEDGTIIVGTSTSQMNLTSFAVVEYAKVDSFDEEIGSLTFVDSAPRNSGLYVVRVSVEPGTKNGKVCNYSGEMIWYQRINKDSLSVNITVSDAYDFQYEGIPDVKVMKGAQEKSNVEWSYTFYYYDASRMLSNVETCQEQYRVPADKLRNYTKTPTDAGTYVVKVEIIDGNYYGENYARYTISQVGDNTPNVTFAWPSINPSSLNQNVELCYGQPLSEVRLSTGSGYYLRYAYTTYVAGRLVASMEFVPGEFFVAYTTYKLWLTDNSRKDNAASRADYVSAMKNYSNREANEAGYTDFYICFHADDETNFSFMYKQATIKIGRAALDWTNVSIAPISYETMVAYTDGNAMDSTIAVDKKVALVYSTNGTLPVGLSQDKYYVVGKNVYVYLNEDSYTLKLTSAQGENPYSVGTTYLTFRYTPEAAYENNFATEDNNCALVVNKKLLNTSLPANKTVENSSVYVFGGIVHTSYNSYDEQDTARFFNFTGVQSAVTQVLPEFNGVYIYTSGGKTYVKSGAKYLLTYEKEVSDDQIHAVWSVVEEMKDGRGELIYDSLGLVRTEIKRKEMQYGDIGKSYTVAEYVSVLPAGAYSVLFVVDNANYSNYWISGAGSTYFTYSLTIDKAELTCDKAPQIENESTALCYNALIDSLNFYDGKVVATKSGETVNGRFLMDTERYTIERFGNYNSSIVIYYKFVPYDENNYEILKGNLGVKTVNKQDISSVMGLEVGEYIYSHGHGLYNVLTKDYFFDSSKATNATYVSNYRSLVLGENKFDFTATFAANSPLGLSDCDLKIIGRSDGEYIDAGNYTVELSVKSSIQNYCGTISATLTVKKDTACIVLIKDAASLGNPETYFTDYVVKKTYNTNSMPQSVTPAILDSEGRKVSNVGVVSVYSHNGTTINTPSSIGSYSVRLSLGNTKNYMLVAATYDNGWQQRNAEISFISATLVIGINTSEIRIRNIEQVYSEPQSVSVNLGGNSAYCTVEYVRLKATTEDETTTYTEIGNRFVDDFPTEAGEYNIHLIFKAELNEGYEDDVIWNQHLVIGKYEAKITSPDTAITSYTGRYNEVITIYTEPYGLRLNYSYCPDGSEEYISASGLAQIGSLHAGKYKVKIAIDNDNYKGEKIVSLTVNQAKLRALEAPAFTTYTYNSDVLPDPVPDKGRVYCPERSEQTITGTFSLIKEEIQTLSVGIQNVTYRFTPDAILDASDGNYYSDYAVLEGRVSVTIQKAPYDMTLVSLYYNDNNDLLEESDYTVEYNGVKYELSAKYVVSAGDVTYIYQHDSVNSDFYIEVTHYFNGNNVSPIGIGSYTVQAEVKSANYTGKRTWTHNLVIVRGEPVISVQPTVGATIVVDIDAGHRGTCLTSGLLNGGKATVKGYPDREITGEFSVPDTYFTKANRNEAIVTFTPHEIGYYKPVSFSFYVNVVGYDAFSLATSAGSEETLDTKDRGETANNTDWTSALARTGEACSRRISPILSLTGSISDSHEHGAYIAISPSGGETYLTYGVGLSSFKLEFKPFVSGCASCNQAVETLNANGVLRYADDQTFGSVPNVGDDVRVTYSLYSSADPEKKVLNDMTGNINLGAILRKVQLSPNVSIELIGFDGKKLPEEYRLNITSGSKIVDGIQSISFADPSATFVFDTTNLTLAQNDMNVRISSFEAVNYEFTSAPTVRLKVYTELSSSDIIVGKTIKVYDGGGIGVKDLLLSVTNTGVPVPESAFALTIYDEKGNLSSGAEIGTYSVHILLKDSEYFYYGEKTVSFTVTKRDVSSEISLTKTVDTYASSTINVDPGVRLQTGEDSILLPASAVTIRYRLSGSGSEFISNVTDAGLYDVKVVVSTDNYYGEAILSYLIEPKRVTMENDRRYTFVYGNERTEDREIIIRFTDGSDMDKIVYFHKEGYSMTTTVPIDAGVYTVTVVLTNPNYYLVNNTFDYIIAEKGITIETMPTIQTQQSNNQVYHLKYGSKLNALNTKFLGGKAVLETGTVIDGKFIVDPKHGNDVLGVGTQTVTVYFVPASQNYADVSFTMDVVIAPVELKVEFTNLSAYYNGASKTLVKKAASGIGDYLISGASEDVDIDIVFIDVLYGTETTKPVKAGTYAMRVTSKNKNYIVTTTRVYGGDEDSSPVFVINKAKVNEEKTERSKPTAVSVIVGQSLMQSSLNGGATFYEGFGNAVSGTYSFVQTARSFKKAGKETVAYVFTPSDVNNFDSYRSTVEITIGKGKAEIRWKNVEVTYGTPADFSALRSMFTTSPANLFYTVSTYDVRNNKLYDDSGEPLYMDANTYVFTCQIEDDNYESQVYQFNYVVKKKVLDMSFVNAKGDVVTAYNVLYSRDVFYGVRLYDSNTTLDKSTYLARDAETIYNNIQYNFTSKDDNGQSYNSRSVPTAMATYYITATLVHQNYEAKVTATYKIAKGNVEEINFDLNSLTKQIYGSVSAPIIVTVPTDVHYYVIYQGYDQVIPTDVGSYNITVYIDDISYNSKQVTAVFKINPKPLTVSSYTVTDKVYDGTTTIAVTGQLSGVLFNDEVSLSLRGATVDDSAEAGKHGVKITSYSLSGLRAGNYALTLPDCTETVTIKTATVKATTGNSYMTSNDGFEEGTGISFYEVDTAKNETSTASKALGASSTVIGYTISVNGESAITTGQYKICVEIPEEYRTTDFTVDFSGEVLDPHREGDMYVFNTSVSSGQVIFSRSSFKYTYAIIIAAAAIVLIGVILLLVLNPLKRKQ